MAATTSNQNLLNAIHRLLGSTLLVTMTDGRVAEGKFVCLDRLGNIILEDVTERREITYDSGDGGQDSVYRWETERSLSQAVIPGDRLARIQIDKDEYHSRIESLQT